MQSGSASEHAWYPRRDSNHQPSGPKSEESILPHHPTAPTGMVLPRIDAVFGGYRPRRDCTSLLGTIANCGQNCSQDWGQSAIRPLWLCPDSRVIVARRHGAAGPLPDQHHCQYLRARIRGRAAGSGRHNGPCTRLRYVDPGVKHPKDWPYPHHRSPPIGRITVNAIRAAAEISTRGRLVLVLACAYGVGVPCSSDSVNAG